MNSLIINNSPTSLRMMPTQISVPETWGSCPISGIGMMHPVIGKDGHRYEAQELLASCKIYMGIKALLREKQYCRLFMITSINKN